MPHALAQTRPTTRRGFSPLRLLNWLASRQADRRMRQSLLDMDAHLLCDIGVTREQALAEVGQGDWAAPDHWTERTTPPHQ